MPSVLERVKGNLAYVFIALGVAWLILSAYTGSLLLLWPVLAFVVSGLLLKFLPEQKITGAWATSSAVMGLAICAWQAITAAPMATGAFAVLAAGSAVGFVLFGLAHLLVIYYAYGAGAPEST